MVIDTRANLKMAEERDMVYDENSIGTYYYSNGDKYEGNWFNGYKHGKGI